jgi:predicted branched-subunit amino acid permease
MYGMILISAVGWVLGTFLGASAGELLPPSVTSAMGIVLYGMFIAIIIPPSRKRKSILFVTIAAALLSIFFRYVLTFISGGFAMMICAIVAAALGAWLFPVPDEGEGT